MELGEQIKRAINYGLSDSEPTRLRTLAKVESGSLLRNDNPQEHFYLMFLAIDSEAKQVLVVKLLNGSAWEFTGGHIESGETIARTLNRLIWEQLRLPVQFSESPIPFMVSIGDDTVNSSFPCTTHYLLWYLVEATQSNVNLEAAEFVDACWVGIDHLDDFIKDRVGITALGRIVGLLQT
jgi:8-oxo-dGTP pyrophosphatase MutT (NUDIX family)